MFIYRLYTLLGYSSVCRAIEPSCYFGLHMNDDDVVVVNKLKQLKKWLNYSHMSRSQRSSTVYGRIRSLHNLYRFTWIFSWYWLTTYISGNTMGVNLTFSVFLIFLRNPDSRVLDEYIRNKWGILRGVNLWCFNGLIIVEDWPFSTLWGNYKYL